MSFTGAELRSWIPAFRSRWDASSRFRPLSPALAVAGIMLLAGCGALGAGGTRPGAGKASATAGSKSPAQPAQGRTGEVEAVIYQTASTNTPEITWSIMTNGTVVRKTGAHLAKPASQEIITDARSTAWAILADLKAIGGVHAIQTGHCAKSASFGTQTLLVYDGATSGDLQCVLAPDGKVQQLLTALKQLGIPVS